MNKRGEFVVLEGMDGSGKTYQSTLLKSWFDELGIRNRHTEEHWKGDVLGLAIDTVVEQKQAKLDPLALQMTFLANRVNHTAAVIKPLMSEGCLVLSDRYKESTINYANDEHRQFIIDQTEYLIRMGAILEPDLTILLDVPVDEAVERLVSRRDGSLRAYGEMRALKKELTMVAADGDKRGRESIFEKKPNLERVRANYLERFNGSDTRMIIVDGVGTIEEVHERIRGEIQRRKIILLV